MKDRGTIAFERPKVNCLEIWRFEEFGYRKIGHDLDVESLRIEASKTHREAKSPLVISI